MTAQDVLTILRSMRLAPLDYERRLQDTINDALVAADCVFQREYWLGPHAQIDFLIAPGIGLEAKKGRVNSRKVQTQVQRYTSFDEIREIILVVERGLFRLPAAVNGKTVTMLSVSRLWGVAL